MDNLCVLTAAKLANLPSPVLKAGSHGNTSVALLWQERNVPNVTYRLQRLYTRRQEAEWGYQEDVRWVHGKGILVTNLHPFTSYIVSTLIPKTLLHKLTVFETNGCSYTLSQVNIVERQALCHKTYNPWYRYHTLYNINLWHTCISSHGFPVVFRGGSRNSWRGIRGPRKGVSVAIFKLITKGG